MPGDASRRNNFRFQAQYGLATYAQCGTLDAGHVGAHFESLGASAVIGRENHADGGIHLHCFFDFGRKFSSRATDIFDVDGFHPNILPGRRTPEAMWDYATKDSAGEPEYCSEAFQRPAGGGISTRDSKWRDIVNSSSRSEFIESALQLDPRSTVTSWGQISKFCDWKYPETAPRYETPRGIDFRGVGEYPALADWVDDNIYGWIRGER